MSGRRERGSAVVEFALIVPILILIVLGIAEFGRAYQAQTMLSQAAREAARSMAINDDAALAKTTAVGYFPALGLTPGQIAVSPASCTAGQAVTITITQPFTFLTGMFGDNINLTGTGSMRCNG